MSTFKRLLALSLALAMILSVSAFAGNYTDSTYADAGMIDEDCEDAVELMYALDIMTGDNSTGSLKFNPTATITRAEMAKMIYVVLNYGEDDKAASYTGGRVFTDVKAGDWYEGYVNYAAATKLVQGRGNGTFGPNDPITTAEAAKMLLTAIGYSAEARGYTGVNWDKNVLSDASIIGLLEGYKANINTFAPRQWVAVMMSNMLLNAWTYNSMTPVFSGLLVNNNDTGESSIKGISLMGTKYYDLDTYVGYLYATNRVYIDQAWTDGDKDDLTTTAGSGNVIFAKNMNSYLEVENPGVGYMDLGQQFRVIYNVETYEVYSAKPTGTSVVAESIAKEIEVETARATSSNDAKNKYQFTIGDLEAKFDSYNIKAIATSDRASFDNDLFIIEDIRDTDDDGVYVESGYAADDLRTVAGDNNADLYRAIDKNGDGSIDYMIIVEYTYGAVEKTGEHKSYGEYFEAVGVDGKSYDPAGYTGDKWYLEDVVNTEYDIEKGNYIKVNYNLDNRAYDVEVLPVVSEATYEKRTTKGVHTIGGEEYVIADENFEDAKKEKVLVSKNLKQDLNLVVDGEMIVFAQLVDSDYTDLAEINEQLVMVTDAYVDVFSNSKFNEYFIDYYTIDGEFHKKVSYDLAEAEDTTYGVTYADLTGDANVNNSLEDDEDEGYLGKNYRLFALHETEDGVILLKLTDRNAQEILDYSDSLLDGYHEESNVGIDTEDNEIGLDDYVESENTFFISYKTKEDGPMKYAVTTIDELGDGKTSQDVVQGLYETKRSYNLYLAGHLYLGVLNLNDGDGYLYTTSDGAYLVDKDDTWFMTDVVFDNGEELEEIRIDTIDGKDVSESNQPKANSLYSFTYLKDKGEKVYSLTLVKEDAGQADFTYGTDFYKDDATAHELINVYEADNGDEIVRSSGEKLTMASSYDIILKNVVLDRKSNEAGGNDNLYFSVSSQISFIDFDTLIDEDLMRDDDAEYPYSIYNFNGVYGSGSNGEYDDTYEYYSDYQYVLNDSGEIKTLYVITYAVEREAQLGE